MLTLLAPIEIEPGPVPVQVAIGDRRFPTGRAIMLQVATPTGVNIYFMSEAGARGLRDMLDAALGGIVLAKPGDITS